MKKVFIAIALVGVLSSCNNKEKEQQEAQLAQFANAKAVEDAKQAVLDSLRLDSLDKAKMQAEADAKAVAARKSSSNVKQTATGSSSSNSNYGGTTTQQKKGWSDAAKGATIGGVAGAVGGAIIDKKSGRGAVIGGVVGAGTGYVIGREKDKKTGRVQPKNNE